MFEPPSTHGILSGAIVAMLSLGPAPVIAHGVAFQPAAASRSTAMPAAPNVASVVLLVLGKLGVDFSVPEADIKQWLANRQSTPYPALADALLLVLDGKRLRQPVYLDVIAWNYEHGPGASSPRDVSQVDFTRLRAAVLEGYNTRHGQAVRDFHSLLQ